MICLRQFNPASHPVALANAIRSIHEGIPIKDVYVVEPSAFKVIPNTPFAYWVSPSIRMLFTQHPPFEPGIGTARQGLGTADNFRFVRLAWEVPRSNEIQPSQRWYPFAKGGMFAPYYADIYLLVNWSRNGNEIKTNVNEKGMIRSNVWMLGDTAANYFGKPGLTWTAATTSDLSVRSLPSDCIFSHTGPCAFLGEDDLLTALALMNSKIVAVLVKLQLGLAGAGRKHYLVGIVQHLPWPRRSNRGPLGKLAATREAWGNRRRTGAASITNSAFHAPALAPGRKPKPTR
jgi:hypothetical protein